VIRSGRFLKKTFLIIKLYRLSMRYLKIREAEQMYRAQREIT